MILVTGASGRVGRPLVGALAQRGERVRALVHKLDHAEGLAAPGVEIVEADFAVPEMLDAALQGIKAAFLVPPDALNQVRVEANFIDAAKRAGLELLVKLSIIGADSKSPGAIAQWHGMAERRIEASGLPYVFLRPNFCMQNMLWFAPSIKAEDRFRMAAGAGRAALVDARDVANVGAAVLTEPGHVGRTYTLTGPRALDFTQVADLLSAELGRKIAFIDASISDFKQVVMEWGASDPYAEALLAVWRPVCAGRYEPVTDDVRMVTGVPPTDFAQFARDYAGAFR